MKQADRVYSTFIRTCCGYLDGLIKGLFEVLESNVLNGSSVCLKDDYFVLRIKNLVSNMNDLSQKQLSLDEAKSKIKMSLAENRRVVKVVDDVFEQYSGDATAMSLKKSQLIGPTMKLRKTLHEAMNVLEKGVE